MEKNSTHTTLHKWLYCFYFVFEFVISKSSLIYHYRFCVFHRSISILKSPRDMSIRLYSYIFPYVYYLLWNRPTSPITHSWTQSSHLLTRHTPPFTCTRSSRHTCIDCAAYLLHKLTLPTYLPTFPHTHMYMRIRIHTYIHIHTYTCICTFTCV